MPAEKLRGTPGAIAVRIPDPRRLLSYKSKRSDQTPKGPGYFGELSRIDEPEIYVTELPTIFVIEDKPILAPVLVPTLTIEELAHLVDGGQPTIAILGKAYSFLLARLKIGKSPFAELGEQQPLPKATR